MARSPKKTAYKANGNSVADLNDVFTYHGSKLSFYGQESKDFTYRLCRMNLSIHGINGNIQLGNSYTDD